MAKKKQNNQWIWIIGIVVLLFMFNGGKKEAGCVSNEPTTLEGYKSELEKWTNKECKIFSKEEIQMPNNLLICSNFFIGDIISPLQGDYVINIKGVDVYVDDITVQECKSYGGICLIGYQWYGANGFSISVTEPEEKTDFESNILPNEFLTKYFNTFYTCQDTNGGTTNGNGGTTGTTSENIFTKVYGGLELWIWLLIGFGAIILFKTLS